MTPRPTAAFWFFAAATCAALVALFWSAVDAFSLTMERNHAIIAAFAFELSAVAEAVALARARKFGDYPVPLLFIVLSVVGSGVYNFAQVRNNAQANGITDPLFLSVFALGPLLAMVGLAMNTGRELRKWEDAKDAHAAAKQHAAQSQAAQQARATEQAAYDAQRAQERAAQRAHELELAKLQLANAAQSTRKADDNATQGHAQSGTTTAQRVAQWRADNPQGNKAQCAAALGIHASTVGRNWK